MSIRKLEKSDYVDFMNLINNFTRGELDIVPYADFVRWYDMLSPLVHVFVYCTDDDKIIGTIRVILEPKFSNNLTFCGHIEDVTVSCEHRRKGIATIMVNYCTQFCRENGCYKVTLNCRDELRHVYEHCGFSLKGVEMGIHFN